jgi:hypothetical protein
MTTKPRSKGTSARVGRTMADRSLRTLVILCVSAVSVSAQQSGQVLPTQMSRWDAILATAITCGAIGLFVLAFLLPWLVVIPKYNWDWRLDVRKRTLWPSCAVAGLGVLLALPLLFQDGFDWLFGFLKVDPAYFDNLSVPFGYRGILNGIVGTKAPVGAQFPLIVFVFVLMALLGGLFAWAVHVGLGYWKSPAGRTRQARERAKAERISGA